jgi:hypothetical protein
LLATASAIQAREAAQAAAVPATQDGDILDIDPDAPIPFEISEQGLAALGTPPISGLAACPRCGRVRPVVYGTGSHRCYGCWRSFVPQSPAA